MVRCFISPGQWQQGSAVLSPEDARHIISVMRLRTGDRISALDGMGRIAVAELISTSGRGQARIRILDETVRQVPLPSPALVLAQALPKHGLMDRIIQKSVELGMSAVVPVLTERVVARPGTGSSADRIARWQRIAIEAAKQCGAAWLPEIHPITPIEHLLPLLNEPGARLVASLRKNAVPLQDALRSFRETSVERLAILVGPEGDLTDAEYDNFQSAGAIPVSLGPRVLRAETAAMFVMSVLSYEFGPRSGP